MQIHKKYITKKTKIILTSLLALFIISPASWLVASAETITTIASTNLIPNPSLETGTSVPDSWNKGRFGSNTANFTYPETGIDGLRAIRIDMTAHSIGDAKWYSYDIPILPSTTYVFSDRYYSNVLTHINLRYRIISDEDYPNHTDEMRGKSVTKFRYVNIGEVPVSTTTTTRQFTFTTPKNAISLTVFHLIDRVGYLVTDNYFLTQSDGIPVVIPDPVTTDVTLPVISISEPIADTTVFGTSTINMTASDNIGVAGVTFKLDGNMIGTEMTTSPYTFAWNTILATEGTHTLIAYARDAAGNIGTSTEVRVTVNNTNVSPSDINPPVVSITAPIQGISVIGTGTVFVSAVDNVGVTGVKILLDGTEVGSEVLNAPYNFTWNSLSVSNGLHKIKAQARDAAGNIGTSTETSVVVNNGTTPTSDSITPNVSIITPADNASVSGTTQISVTATDNLALASDDLFIDGVLAAHLSLALPATFNWDTLPLTDGIYTIFAVAKDTTGNTATSSAIAVTVDNTLNADVIAPVVSLQSPIAGTTVTGTSILVSVNATDTIGVAGVTVYLDGIIASSEILTMPYSFVWDTTGAVNGTHQLMAQALDEVGNIGTSTPITVTVAN